MKAINLKLALLCTAFILLHHTSVLAQNDEKMRPGMIYEAGDKLYSPTYGIRGEVPLGWHGALPRDTELFLLVPTHVTTDVEIYTFAIEDNLTAIKQRWERPIEISSGILSQPQGAPKQEENMLIQNFSFSNRPDYQAVGYAKCGAFGQCAISFLVGNLKQMPKAGQSQEEFMQSLVFEKPDPSAAREPFDWQAFLPDKHIFTYYHAQSDPHKSNLYLCPDGSFSSDISRKGALEAWKQYAGRQKGTYEFEPLENGTAQLTLRFKKEKLPPLQVNLMMEDNKLFMNEVRVMAVANTDCK
ncbi:hypothetical protein WJR50_18695 [Catalinimonas sp. 4WD22]|uniref:hypothetical protein n=1 Tax=Catalinimonas locisalis TaxID=3133978 RepID=UPI003101496D